MRLSQVPVGKFSHIPYILPSNYSSFESRAKTVTVLGSSKTKEGLLPYMDLCKRVVGKLVQNGYDILHGCGEKGIMGEAYVAARENSIKDILGKPRQNLAIVTEPAWGDEDIEHCIPIAKAHSEADRIEKFLQASDNFLIFPGGETLLEELTTIVQRNEHLKNGDTPKKIVLVGRDLFAGMIQQYQDFATLGTSKPPKNLFKVLNTESEIMQEFPRLDKFA